MPESLTLSSFDLGTLARLYQASDLSPRQVITSILQRIAAHQDPAVWIHLIPQEALLCQADSVGKRRAQGEALPLYGIPFAVKDMIDVAGLPTTAGCPAFSYTAKRTAPVVSRLLKAGAILVGKTNLDQFATGLAGDRSPYGACGNVFDAAYISGGSSSGSAVAVAAGLVSFALGTDTAGSGRVPAGCNNLVGLKPTPGLLSTEGVVPACRSLDCVAIFALTTEDALAVCRVASAGGWVNSDRLHAVEPGGTASMRSLPTAVASADPVGEISLQDCTFTTPRDEDLEFFGDENQADLFRQALDHLQQMGARRVSIDFGPFREVASLLYDGPWVAERLAAVGDFLKIHGSEMHPVTRAIIEGGRRYSAVDVFKGQYRLNALRETCLKILGQGEVLVVPTLPTIPTLTQVKADSIGWSRRLGYYTNFVNLLGLAAIVLPSGFTPHGLPASITLVGPGGSDRRLCELGMAWQRRLNLPLGATGRPLALSAWPAVETPPCRSVEGCVRLAVAGAHLRGQPLHRDLLRTGARFIRACRTAARYRFVALLDLDPPRPGLLRDEEHGGSVQLEVYDLPVAGFGTLVASVAQPLAIGTIELEDGEAVKGFLCESWAAARAKDITEFGGWVAFRDRVAQGVPDSSLVRKPSARRRQRCSGKENS